MSAEGDGTIPDDGDTTMSLREAAERIGVHYMTAYRYVRGGRLPARKVGSGWRVDAEDLRRLVDGEDPETRNLLQGAGPRGTHRVRLEATLIAGDEAGAWGVFESAMAAGADPDELLLDMLAPSMASIGERWAAGELSISDEHRASAAALRLVSRLGPRFARRGRKRGSIVIGCVAGDRHSLPTAIMRDLLRGEGFEVIDLGADTPAESFVEACSGADRLVAVALCVTAPQVETSVRTTVELLRSAEVGVPVVVGGGAVVSEDAAYALGADRWSSDARSALVMFGELASARRAAGGSVAGDAG